MKSAKSKNGKRIYFICLVATMAAMVVVLENFLSINIDVNLKITLHGLPLLVVGILYGPIFGLITGLVAGVIAQLTSKYGVDITSVFWVLAYLAWGYVSGLLFKVFKNMKVMPRYVLSILGASVSATLLNTFAMLISTVLIKNSGYTFASIMVNLPIRLLNMVLSLIPYVLICRIVCERIKIYLEE